ncbi:hypothetical protein DPMN_169032 [Dreissena polymorpha]|uniref:Uncharacterized protein n=1 Tax=Dreissena polymorpha TaxID=45954 RepID=A0A9D4F1T9_DREPO|nr:hypothetical protein DPMN_169032 [Dreissena polymorpha]
MKPHIPVSVKSPVQDVTNRMVYPPAIEKHCCETALSNHDAHHRDCCLSSGFKCMA